MTLDSTYEADLLRLNPSSLLPLVYHMLVNAAKANGSTLVEDSQSGCTYVDAIHFS